MPIPKPDRRATYFRMQKPGVDLPYRIRRVGRNRYINYHSTYSTYHEDATLNIFVDGLGHFYKAGQHIVVKQGDVLLDPGTQESGLLFADKKNPYDHFYCRFTGDEALRAAQRIFDNYGHGQNVFAWDKWTLGVDYFRRLMSHWDENSVQPEDRLTVADAILAELLAELDCAEKAEPTHINSDILNAYMSDHLHDPVELDKMADYFGISKSHLCRVGKSTLGQPIGKVWELMKIEWAKTLLQETQVRVAEVARHVGFQDPFYFSRVFKKHTGESPKTWQTEQHRQHRSVQARPGRQ